MKKESSISVKIADQQTCLPLDFARLRQAVRTALAEGAVAKGRISVAVVDDATIARLNKQFLDHDGPTDVLSFPLDVRPGSVEAEIVVSAETAVREAPNYGWDAHDELLLYVVHGALHLVGYDDHSDADRARMEAKQQAIVKDVAVKSVAVKEEGPARD